jgi:hypothetical protein
MPLKCLKTMLLLVAVGCFFTLALLSLMSIAPSARAGAGLVAIICAIVGTLSLGALLGMQFAKRK